MVNIRWIHGAYEKSYKKKTYLKYGKRIRDSKEFEVCETAVYEKVTLFGPSVSIGKKIQSGASDKYRKIF